jgi:hypothetical protein
LFFLWGTGKETEGVLRGVVGAGSDDAVIGGVIKLISLVINCLSHTLQRAGWGLPGAPTGKPLPSCQDGVGAPEDAEAARREW